MLPQHKRVVALDECQPDFEKHKCPVHITETRKRDGVLYVTGSGPRNSEVMFVTPALEEEEATSVSESVYNVKIKEEPQVLKGGIGNMLKEAASLANLNLDAHYTTAFIKWLLPKTKRNKPDKEAIAWALPAFEDELREVKPKIIVCFGKIAFDHLVPIKINQSDALGAWFWSETHKARIFLMDKPIMLMMKPEKLETFRILFKEVKNMIDKVNGIDIEENKPIMHFVRNVADLRAMVQMWSRAGLKLFCVDCEWKGNNHVDGQLRSIQFGWSANEGTCVTFLNCKGEYTMDASYVEVGAILGEWLNQPDVKYVGHFIQADLPWMSRWLNLDWYDKCVFDTAFALQTVDEASGMGLEVLSMTYTTYGRYDFDLMMWKKANKPDHDDGYGTIPDEILEPYSVLDVLVPMAAMPYLQQRLRNDNLERYYNQMLLPFVSNVFTSFGLTGLPIDVSTLDHLREMFHFAKEHLRAKFQQLVADESWMLLARAMQEKGDLKNLPFIAECRALVRAGTPHLIVDAAKARFGVGWSKYEIFLTHCADAPNFNSNSKPQMLRWLFKCKGLLPIKTTDNKEKGLRSMPWEKVLELPEDRQREFVPATDKQTLTILSEQAPILSKLLELKDIENLCKAFLKEASIDEETGELDRENGLHYYVCSDKRFHGMYSLTETGRPRAFFPNILNLPSYVTERIAETLFELFTELYLKGELPEMLHRYVDKGDGKYEKVRSIRSSISADPGWCIVESDYQTAEIRGLAYISGDLNLMKFMDDVDPSFGFAKNAKGKWVPVRLFYEAESVSGILLAEQDPKCLLNIWDNAKTGQWVSEVTEADLKRDAEGAIVHPKYDLHWSLAEMVYEKPREKMIAKLHRGAGKVGNFCVADNQPILTARGWIAIQDLLDCDWLWDGVEWVQHEGLQCNGVKEVLNYDGLKATYNHDVWDLKGEKLHLGEASAQRVKLAGIGREGCEDICRGPDHFPGKRPGQGLRLFLRDDRMSALWETSGKRTPQHGEGILQQVPLPTGWWARWLRGCSGVGENFGIAIQRYGSALRKGYTRLLSQLQGPRDQGAVCIAPRLRDVGVGEMAGRNLQGEGFRSPGERRALREGQPSTGYPGSESAQSQGHSGYPHRSCAGIPAAAPACEIHGEDLFGLAALRDFYLRNPGATRQEHEGRLEEAVTYDIRNVGPRNRFVCAGVLVSNSSAYGASDATLERKIESDTGKKPEPGTGRKLLDSLQKRQPVATEFLEFLEQVPAKVGVYVAASGRRRRFHRHPHHVQGLTGRTIRGHLSALGREARNFPMQESVAAAAQRTGNGLLRFKRAWRLEGYPIAILYDSAVTHCPLEEREIWRLAHELFMHLSNGWAYDDRILRYPVDHELNIAWSYEPPEDVLAIWKSDDFKPPQGHLLLAKKWLENQIIKYQRSPRESVWNVAEDAKLFA